MKRPRQRSFLSFENRRRAKQCRRPHRSPPPIYRHSRATECARLRVVTNSRDSWRSHVHRTYTAQRVQPFKLQTRNAGGRGGRPSPFSGGSKGGILFGKRIPPLPRAAPAALQPLPLVREIKREHPLRKENTPFDKAAPIQISILTPCVSMVMMHPAMVTPRKMTGTARFKRISSTAAMSAPVHAPVPGSGMATKSSRPHVW